MTGCFLMLVLLFPCGTLLLFDHKVLHELMQEPHMYSFDLIFSNRLNDQESDNNVYDHNKTEM